MSAAGPEMASPSPTRKRHRAYVFYATNDTYAVAVLVFVRSLQRLGGDHDADLVVLHLRLSRYLIAKLHELGIRTRRVATLRHAHGRHYRDCLIKLRIFELDDYERVIFVDVDALPLKRLDALFDLPSADAIAAPCAYWLPQPFWGSHLLVVKPSPELWNRVSKHFPHASASRSYDMEIVNAEFGGEIRTLPADVVCLNSEWEEVHRPSVFDDLDRACADVGVVHFTALGKPWSYSPQRVRRLRPHAHPFFYDLWERWWRTREELFAGTSLWVRIRFLILKTFCLRAELRSAVLHLARQVGRARAADA